MAIEDRRNGLLLFRELGKCSSRSLEYSRVEFRGRRTYLSSHCIRIDLAGQLGKARCTNDER
jgi:hypothetical protein